MKNLLLCILICFSTCVWAQSFSQKFVADDVYGISNSALETNPEISIFPNPASDFITIEDKKDMVKKVTFFNVLGKEIISYDASSNKKFNMMDFQNGIYLVQLKDKEGQILQTIRVRKI